MKEFIQKEMVAFPEYDVWNSKYSFDKRLLKRRVIGTPKLEEVSLYEYKGVDYGDDVKEDERTYKVFIGCGYEKDNCVRFVFTLSEDYKEDNGKPVFSVNMEVDYSTEYQPEMTVLQLGELANYATRIFCGYGFDTRFGSTTFK